MSLLLDPELVNKAVIRIGNLLLDERVQFMLVTIPVVLSLFVLFDARRRGLNGALWMIGMLFTGGLLFPLYLLHVWTLPAAEMVDPLPAAQPHFHHPETYRWRIRAKYHCPYCSRGVIEGAVFCNRCGGCVDGIHMQPYFRESRA